MINGNKNRYHRTNIYIYVYTVYIYIYIRNIIQKKVYIYICTYIMVQVAVSQQEVRKSLKARSV